MGIDGVHIEDDKLVCERWSAEWGMPGCMSPGLEDKVTRELEKSRREENLQVRT